MNMRRFLRESVLQGMLALTAATLVATLPQRAIAHPKERPLREIVLVRGTVIDTATECPDGLLVLRALNRFFRLCAADARRIAVAAPKVAEAEALPGEFDLQGERERLAVLTAAAPGARVTVLGEWRPGRKDLFLIEIDVCPCANGAPEGARE